MSMAIFVMFLFLFLDPVILDFWEEEFRFCVFSIIDEEESEESIGW